MRHFAATKPQGDLDLVALFKKAANRLHFGLVIMVINTRPELDFLDFNHLLPLAGLGGLFLFQKAEFAVIEDFADRGIGVRHDFDQIDTRLLRQTQRFHNVRCTAIQAFVINQLNLANSDVAVDAVPVFLGRGRGFHRAANGVLLNVVDLIWVV